MAELFNQADLTGKLGEMDVVASSEVTVILSSVSLLKSAEPMLWIGGELTYTIEAKNIEAVGSPDITLGVIQDIINPALATLVANSVSINDVPATETVDYTFDSATGLLTVNLPDIAPEEVVTVKFRVRKVV